MSAGQLALVSLGVGLTVSIAVIRDRIVEERIMGKTAESLRGVTAKVDKIAGEVKRSLDDFQARLDAKGNLDDEDVRALDELHAKLDRLDELNPDAAPGNPTPTPSTDLVENADTTTEVVAPVVSDTAVHISDGTPIPDPTADVETNPALDGSDQVPEEDDAAAAAKDNSGQ